MFQRDPNNGAGGTRSSAPPPVEDRFGRQAPAPTPPAAPPGGRRVELRAPLIGHHSTINEIVLREPSLGDWIDNGPVARRIMVSRNGEDALELVEDTAALLRWMCALSGIEEALLRTMKAHDFRPVARAVFELVSGNDEGN